MNRRLSQVALSAAAALTFSLAAPVAAQASESGAVTSAVTTAVTKPTAQLSMRSANVSAQAAPITVTALRLGRQYSWDHRITRDANVSSRIAVGGSLAPGYRVDGFTADLFIGGRYIGPLGFSPYASSISWRKRSGYGVAQLRNLRATVYSSASGTQTVALGTSSNNIRIRRDFDSRLQMRYTKRGSKMTVRAYKWRVYQPNGTMASVRKVKLQRLKGGKWRNFKTIKVNRSGNGKVSFKSKPKYKYRLYYGTTTTIQGVRTYASAKV